jgi:hypothetical protein
MTEYLKVEQEPSLSRAIDSGGIVNTDKKAFETYINSRNKKENQARRLDNLESELNEIKNLLLKLLDK